MPVLRNVQDMNYADIEKGIAALGDKAKKNQLAIEDMDGGTFTISNGGVFGSLFGTPIINPPQSAILGMHGTFERPVVRNGQVNFKINFIDCTLICTGIKGWGRAYLAHWVPVWNPVWNPVIKVRA